MYKVKQLKECALAVFIKNVTVQLNTGCPHRAMFTTNLISDLRAVTTACESCTIRPLDKALSLVLKLPVPKATTSHPPARVREVYSYAFLSSIEV